MTSLRYELPVVLMSLMAEETMRSSTAPPTTGSGKMAYQSCRTV